MTPEQRKKVEAYVEMLRFRDDDVLADALDALLTAVAEARAEAYAECVRICVAKKNSRPLSDTLAYLTAYEHGVDDCVFAIERAAEAARET